MSKVSNLTPEKLKELVNLDIRDEANTAQRALLELHRSEWRAILLAMKRDSEFQLASSRAESAEKRLTLSEQEYDEYEANRLRWKANNLRFKNGIENKLAMLNDISMETFSRLKHEVHTLRNAIEIHKDNVLNGDEDDTERYDAELWSVLK